MTDSIESKGDLTAFFFFVFAFVAAILVRQNLGHFRQGFIEFSGILAAAARASRFAAALAALDDDEHLRQTQKTNKAGLKFFESAFKALGIEYVRSYANFILTKVGDGQQVFLNLKKHGVITRPMGSYQLPEWIRISIGTAEQNERCLNALTDLR